MAAGIRRGSQEPTFSVVGGYHHTFGSMVVSMFEKWNVAFYPCQEREIDLLMARDSQNRFACRTICIAKPRQNGKSFAVRFYAIVCASAEGKHVLFTAHRGKTVRKMFKFMRTFVLRTPDLAEKLMPGADGIYKAAGSEGIYFANGGMIEFATRTDGGGRGETYDVIIFDEAQELTDEQYDAVVPTTIASDTGDPQKIYLGTPPGPKCLGTVFKGLHDKAHSGEPQGIWWLEWSVDALPDMADREAVLELAYLTNPAMGYRIREDVMLDAIGSATSTDGFAREFLGWWSESFTGLHPIGAADWAACRADAPPDDPPTAYAVKFSPDGLSGSLAACVLPDGGPPYVEVVANRSLRRGVGWFADWLAERARRVDAIVVDGRANAQTLNDKLLGLGVDPDVISRPATADMIAACSAFVDATKPQSDGDGDDLSGLTDEEAAALPRGVSHYGQPALDASATLSGKRRIGNDGGFGFDGNENADATLVEACALAFWKAVEIGRGEPATEMRMG